MSARMPVLFVSHGSPMVMLDDAQGEPYRQWARQLPRPRAVLVFSAHWETPGLSLGETDKHAELIYDFYGFPDELYEVQYPAPGAPWLAQQVMELLPDEPMRATRRGLDHGVYVPFLHLWPEADVPILQISLPQSFSAKDLFELGKRLAPLRDQGVMIIGAGALTHNLRAWNPRHEGGAEPWAVAFDEWVAATVGSADWQRLFDWQALAPHAQFNHPTAEHFLPLLIAAGAGAGDKVTFPMTGFQYGIFSQRSVQFG